MLRSNLSITISIAELVERLSDGESVDVLRLLQHELGVSKLNTMVNQLIIQVQSTQRLTNQSLTKIEKTIKDKYCQPSSNNVVSVCVTQQKTKTPAANNCNIVFPLLRLPDDLILNTSLFLNEKDIFQFEQCCSVFYKMINYTSYLAKCNNFKEFTMKSD